MAHRNVFHIGWQKAGSSVKQENVNYGRDVFKYYTQTIWREC